MMFVAFKNPCTPVKKNHTHCSICGRGYGDHNIFIYYGPTFEESMKNQDPNEWIVKLCSQGCEKKAIKDKLIPEDYVKF